MKKIWLLLAGAAAALFVWKKKGMKIDMTECFKEDERDDIEEDFRIIREGAVTNAESEEPESVSEDEECEDEADCAI